MLKEFKEFAMKGSVIDLAVGMVIGAAFTAIVKSFVADIITPAIAPLLGKSDFSELVWLNMNIGLFINAVVAFLITAFVIFIVVKGINKMKKQEEEKPEEPQGPTEVELLQEIVNSLKK